MSGDIGKGTTHAAIALAQKALQTKLPGYIQLAGGTNDYTVDKLRQEKMLRRPNLVSDTHSAARFNSISGVAYGSYARAILSPILTQLETTALQNIQNIQLNSTKNKPMNQLDLKLEQDRELLEQAVAIASQLVNQIKSSH